MEARNTKIKIEKEDKYNYYNNINLQCHINCNTTQHGLTWLKCVKVGIISFNGLI